MGPEVNNAQQPRDIYVNVVRRGDELWQRGRLLCRDVKVFVSNQYNHLKRHDKELFPLALIAASVCMLFASNILLLVTSFAAGALYRVARGEAWKEGIVEVVKEAWQGSNIGKIGVAAFLILLVAPMKWSLAAFGLGIYVVHVLQQPQPDPSAPPPAQLPERQAQQEQPQPVAIAAPVVAPLGVPLQPVAQQPVQVGLPPQVQAHIAGLMQYLQQIQLPQAMPQ